MVGCEGLGGILMKKDGTSELDMFYPIRSECHADIPKTRFKLRAGKTLSARRWRAAFSEDGHLDIAKVLRRIQRGGVHPSIKAVVWEFLLGCFDPNSTFEDRSQLRERRREMYGTWKAECQKMVPAIGSGKFITAPIITDGGQTNEESSTNSDLQDQNGVMSTHLPDSSLDCGGHVNNAVSDNKVIQWKRSLHQIGLDVVRTDRVLVFYESETNQAKLWDVLAVYAWVDNDIGYIQGMSDICSTMVILLENEADAFWCFEHAMRRLRENFRCSTSSIGVQAQLCTLSQIIKVIDPKLHQHLEDLDGGEYLFAFRMLMVLFRREFSFVDTLYLWELMWAMEYNPNIFTSYEGPRDATDSGFAPKINHKLLKQYGEFERKIVTTGRREQHSALAVFLVASILETKNKQLRKKAKGLDDIVKILGDITGNLDAKKACKDALKIHKKYLSKTNKS
ncbi:rab GTPase-activating protein 22-like isoform X2 [Corylus avellana]|uniref:rab GTPase-activating protein 22-like isoform X2 n=1 Tax=Corylus avellana TaxID=13451 RepID=UPI00286B58AA|nr:rab GTPase-activating protein 22-like isoform X2 [Corylus avellana]